MAKLTEKQELFCKEYIIDLNATQAAIRAGYDFNEEPPKSGYYVYALVCSITNRVFYIGKGKEGRVFHHVKNRLKKQVNNQKNEIINNCIKNGGRVNHIILHKLSVESNAYDNEVDVISAIGIEKLANVSIAKGGGRESEYGILGNPSDFNSNSEWARNALSVISKCKRDITFLGKRINADEVLIPFLMRVANG